MATLFPREEKAEGLFDEILKDPSACRRLMHAFYDALNYEEGLGIDELPPQKFAKALFNAYENKDLTAFLMAVCQHSMFDLLRSAFLVPFRFNADGEPNPVLLTDDEGKLPRAIVYYGQDSLQENGKRYDELGVFLPLEHFSGSMEKHIKIADSIVYSEEEK